jgi:hypothetical protein
MAVVRERAALLALIAGHDGFRQTLYGCVEGFVRHNAKAGMLRCWEAYRTARTPVDCGP